MRVDGERVVPENGSLAGEYTIDTIRLNSPVHRERRNARKRNARRFEVLQLKVEKSREELAKLPVDSHAVGLLLDELEDELAKLRNEAESLTADPWDKPLSCACPTGPSAGQSSSSAE